LVRKLNESAVERVVHDEPTAPPASPKPLPIPRKPRRCDYPLCPTPHKGVARPRTTHWACLILKAQARRLAKASSQELVQASL
jgi:hypothetical protein